MVFNWNIKQIVNKKITASSEDKKDWNDFTKQMANVSNKETYLRPQDNTTNKIPKLDLHGFSLDEANKKAKKFVIEFYNKGYKKLLIVTGKGSRSKSYDNPYVSEKLSILKHSVPEYISCDKILLNKISKITKADIKDGGEGAIYIFLKKNKTIE